MARPVLVFDVNETLLDLTVLEPLFARLFGRASVLREFFPEMILYSEALTLSGYHVPFDRLAAGTLRMVGANHGVAVGEADVAELRERIGAMPAHADAEPALTRLRDAGFRLATLTNSPPSDGPTALDRSGLAALFERTMSVEAVGRYKPHPDTYRHAADRLGVAVAELCLVACHLWDVIGIQGAGGKGALVRRPHNHPLPAEGVPAPDLDVPDFHALADRLIAGALDR